MMTGKMPLISPQKVFGRSLPASPHAAIRSPPSRHGQPALSPDSLIANKRRHRERDEPKARSLFDILKSDTDSTAFDRVTQRKVRGRRI
jgi:hypothetical protein